MAARFHPNYRGVGDMLKAPWLQADMERRAKKVAARARETAPYDASAGDPHYRDSFFVSSGIRKDRAYGRVTNSVPWAALVEYGGRNVPRHRTLGKALDAAKE